MTLVSARLPDLGEVGAITIVGWLAGSFVAGLVFLAVTLSLSGVDVTVVLLAPFAFFLVPVGAALVSAVFVLPVSILLISILRSFEVGGRSGGIVCVAVSVAYAYMLATSGEWQLLDGVWYLAPVYGGALGVTYLRIIDA